MTVDAQTLVDEIKKAMNSSLMNNKAVAECESKLEILLELTKRTEKTPSSAWTRNTPIMWMAAVKDRIRWLSRALEKKIAKNKTE